LSLAPGLFAIEVGGYDPALVALLREALALLGSEDARLRALLLARLALALYWADTFDERVAICAEAGRLAQQLGGDDVRAAVLTAQALALSRPANLNERRVLTELAAELCDRAADHQGLLLNRLHRATLLLEAGDLAAARYEAEAFEKLAEQVKQPQAIWIAQALRASRLLLDGRLAEVEALAGVCLQTGERVRDHNALQTFGVHLMLVRVEQGRTAEVLDVLRNYALSYPRTVAWRAVYAFALSRSGQDEKCASEYASTKLSGFNQPDDLLWPCAMAWLAEVCHSQRDAEGARLLYERLSPYAGRFVAVGFAIACLGAVERYLGLLAATMGDLVAARGHFERALTQNRAASAMLPVAHTLYDCALVLRDLGDAEQAAGHLREALALALDRDLLALQARIRALPP
jgi:tetratricopeptide (TPR) repeat protein